MYVNFLDVAIPVEVRGLAKEFRMAAHELLDLLDMHSPTVSRLKVKMSNFYYKICSNRQSFM